MEMATHADLRCHSLASGIVRATYTNLCDVTHRCECRANRPTTGVAEHAVGVAVRFNLSRAGCEDARESRGSHAASLKEGG